MKLVRVRVVTHAEGAERRELLRQLRVHELVHPLGPGQVAEPVQSEIAQGHAVGELRTPVRPTTNDLVASEQMLWPPWAMARSRPPRFGAMP